MAAPTLIILDAGPLAALFDRRDQHHKWAVSAANSLQYPFITSESVISEALFLLEESAASRDRIFQLIEQSLIRIAFNADDHLDALLSLMRRYANLPMSLADATLVRLAELHDHVRVFTTDSHFKIYRRNGRQLIPLIAPWINE